MTLCEPHGRLRCSECAYVDELQERIESAQKERDEWHKAAKEATALLAPMQADRLALKQQVNTLTRIISETGDVGLIVRMELSLHSIKESPREEQTE